jgi:hydroxyacylglutathione hydrolase
MLTGLHPHANLSRWSASTDTPLAQFEIGSMQNLVYLIIDWETRRAAWVDPQKDLSEPLAFLEKHGLLLDSILLTHTHHDHVAGLGMLRERHPEIPIWLHEADAFRLKNSSGLHFVRCDPTRSTSIGVGNLELRAWNMPGHSIGALSFEIPASRNHPVLLLTGDTLFIRDCGRTDLPTGSNAQLFASLQRYRQFPAETIIFPGHHYRAEWWSRLDDEWRLSPPFQCQSVEDLERLP